MILSLDLPIPPSVNNLFGNRSGGRFKTRAYRDWIKAAQASLWTQKPAGGFPFFDGAFAFHLALPAGMRGDCDNRLKGPLDFLKKPASIIADDSKAFDTRAFRDATVPAGMCRVVVSDTPPVTVEAA